MAKETATQSEEILSEIVTVVEETSDLFTVNNLDVLGIYFQDIKNYPLIKKDGTPHTYAGNVYFLCSYKGTNFTTRDVRFKDAIIARDLDNVLFQRVGKNIEMKGYNTLSEIRSFNDSKRAEQISIAKTNATVKQLARMSDVDYKSASISADLLQELERTA